MVAVAAASTVMIVVAAIVPDCRDHTETADECDYFKNAVHLHVFISLNLRPQIPSEAALSGTDDKAGHMPRWSISPLIQALKHDDES